MATRKLHLTSAICLAIFGGIIVVAARGYRSWQAHLAVVERANQTFFDETLCAETRARGDRIAQGLEQYKAAHGGYPKDLAGLVPDFLREIEPPTAGMPEWDYYCERDGTRFSLRFGVDDYYYPCQYYENGTWGINQ